ncbi:pirin [Diplodia corticola]|uniref:Pirin n=1 Tax=Diplodia corticola TaxID=236234 RepID=A0A1J9QPN9_9PEZI|nr:pirin [Diplodia corticola]OJD30886.1 pirin [Diplodia corticola]
MRFLLSSIIVCLAATALYYHHQLDTDTATATIKSTTTAFLQRIKLFAKQRATNPNNMSTTTSAASFPGLPVVPPSDPALAKDAASLQPRRIANVFLAREQAEGAGARVRRSIGTPQLRNFSPFLMLDHFAISPGAGFPDHPHRGQETITYLLEGGVDHEDFAGNRGTIHAGDLQFMTAGRGIVHAEMPAAAAQPPNADGSATSAINIGLQLWVDLPRRLKACEPRYRDLRAAEIPAATADAGRVRVKVISGRSLGVDSVQDLAYTPVWLLDVRVRPGGRFVQPLPAGFNAFVYTLSGTARFLNGGAVSDDDDAQLETDSVPVGPYHNVVFEQQGDGVVVSVAPDAGEEARFIVVAGLPLDQKIVQYGPFVVNSQEEVYQAMMDYSTHTNGFERAKDWQSEIGKSMM